MRIKKLEFRIGGARIEFRIMNLELRIGGASNNNIKNQTSKCKIEEALRAAA